LLETKEIILFYARILLVQANLENQARKILHTANG